MKIIESPRATQQLVESWRRDGQSIGFVPTMGALHEGHLDLLRHARSECDKVIASIFVNPLQFGAGEDFEKYPRPLERDSALLEANGCDALFAPDARAMYGDAGREVLTRVEVRELGALWDGEARPGHFDGVATVVAKLFNITRPHRAYFGEKDYQQLQIITRMARDLDFNIEIVPVPTVREADGLALSSRNAYLSADERRAAPVLHRALQAAIEAAQQGETDVGKLLDIMRAMLAAEPAIRPEYFAIVNAQTLQPLTALGSKPARILIAAYAGTTRLIDNAPIAAVTSHRS